MGLGGSSGSDGDGDVVEGIESKTGGDEGLAGQSWVLPCRRQYVPCRPRSALARRVPGPGAETLLEVIDFRTWPTTGQLAPKKTLSQAVIRVDFSTEEVHKARYMEPRFLPKYKMSRPS